MTFVKLTKDNIDTVSLELHPLRRFVSGTSTGLTGSVRVFPRGSPVEKDSEKVFTPTFSPFVANKQKESLLDSKRAVASGALDISLAMQSYLESVNSQSSSPRRAAERRITRFVPPLRLASGTFAKRSVIDGLFPYYRASRPSMNFAFTNYSCLNFFTASSIPDAAALLYPSSASAAATAVQSGTYSLQGAFSFDFWINPRRANREAHEHFNAGTLFHLSSSYALSLVTGSSRDGTGRADAFRMMLQLSRSADLPPFQARSSLGYPNDLVFLSDDNSLKLNHWHHVTVRWGTNARNDGTGSFVIDGTDRGRFAIPSSTVGLPVSSPAPHVLTVGNYYEGLLGSQGMFFTSDVARREGLLQLIAGSSGVDMPTNFRHRHPLNAEVHDLKIYRKYLDDDEIAELKIGGPAVGKIGTGSLAFYVPPLFVRESPKRRSVNARGGVLVTPFITRDGSTAHPFNVELSFGVAGHDVNVENFVMDFANKIHPRLLYLSSSDIPTTTQALSANDHLWTSASVRYRNLFLLPCDNGQFSPNFSLLVSGTFMRAPREHHPMALFVDDTGHLDLSLVTLKELVPSGSLFGGLDDQAGGVSNVLSGVVGQTPENPRAASGSALTVFQRTRDPSSNEVAFWNIPSIYYGSGIHPGTFMLVDPVLSGSDGIVKIALRDDGNGNLHRADAASKHATWNSVGNVMYEEGIAVVKSPLLPFFGKDRYEMEFRGTHNAHVLKVSAVAPAGKVTSSSNPNFLRVSASLSANDTDREFVYITGINIHDDNLNVVARAQLAQPIVKRTGDRVKFVLRMIH